MSEGAGKIFIDCKRYGQVLKDDTELWDIKLIGTYSNEKLQNPVRANYAAIGFSECSVSAGLLSPECSHMLKRKLVIKTYVPEKDGSEGCLDILSRVCKKLQVHFPNELGSLKILGCGYITSPYSYCAEAELEIRGAYGDEDVLSAAFKEEL